MLAFLRPLAREATPLPLAPPLSPLPPCFIACIPLHPLASPCIGLRPLASPCIRLQALHLPWGVGGSGGRVGVSGLWGRVGVSGRGVGSPPDPAPCPCPKTKKAGFQKPCFLFITFLLLHLRLAHYLPRSPHTCFLPSLTSQFGNESTNPIRHTPTPVSNGKSSIFLPSFCLYS